MAEDLHLTHAAGHWRSCRPQLVSGQQRPTESGPTDGGSTAARPVIGDHAPRRQDMKQARGGKEGQQIAAAPSRTACRIVRFLTKREANFRGVQGRGKCMFMPRIVRFQVHAPCFPCCGGHLDWAVMRAVRVQETTRSRHLE
jgi:hypothetical protein